MSSCIFIHVVMHYMRGHKRVIDYESGLKNTNHVRYVLQNPFELEVIHTLPIAIQATLSIQIVIC